MPLSYLGNMGLVQGINSGDPFFNRLGTTVNEKTFCTSGSSTAWLLTRRPDRRRRPGKLRALQVHRHLGVQFDLDQPAPLAVRARSAEARRQGRRHRQLPVAHGQGRRLAHLPASPAPTARWRWASSIRSSSRAWSIRTMSTSTLTASPELKARAAEFTPDYVEKITGVKAADIAKFAREFATAQPSAIRIGVAIERSAGGAQAIRAVYALPALVGLLAPCRRRHAAVAAVGLPRRLGEGVARPDWIKPGTRVVNNLRLGAGADRRDEARSADQEPVRVLHQSRQPVARDQQDRRGPEARGPVHRRRRALHHRHGEVCRHHPARPPWPARPRT